MGILVRGLTDADRAQCLRIEAAALPGVSYVDDVWEDFTSGRDGAFFGAVVDGELAGIGKITHLYDGYGWLETLRVHPDFQGRGAGKAIYGAYFARAAQMGLRALGMYTESWNARSAGLAGKFGLRVKGRFAEFVRDVRAGDAPEECAEGAVRPGNLLTPVHEAKAEALLAPHYAKMDGFLVVNRTYYPAKAGLAARLARRGWLFRDDVGNVAVLGWRFQPQKAVHLAYFSGDDGEIARVSCALAARVGGGRVSAMREYQNETQRHRLAGMGFAPTGEEFVTLWNG